jgi:hypothetical protein
MICTSSLHEMCDELFASYPPTTGTTDLGDTACAIVLMLQDGDDVTFFVLARDHSAGHSSYTLRPWLSRETVRINADTGYGVPGRFSDVISGGVPIPPDGSLFGWRETLEADVITALIAIFAEYTPGGQEPCWSVMPLAEAPVAQWPPFTREHLFGPWFWDYYRAGNLVSLDDLIATNPGAVFWADTEATLGSGCCVVAGDVEGRGFTLPRGRFVHHSVLDSATLVPSLDVLLAGSGTTDLSSRF